MCATMMGNDVVVRVFANHHLVHTHITTIGVEGYQCDHRVHIWHRLDVIRIDVLDRGLLATLSDGTFHVLDMSLVRVQVRIFKHIHQT
jgi:hypothetical protein